MPRSSVSSVRSSIPNSLRCACRSSGSSAGGRGNRPSFTPGTKTRRNAIPRASSTEPTQTLPKRDSLGAAVSEFNRGPNTSRTSASDTGPISDMGSNSSRSSMTLSGRRRANSASSTRAAIHSPHRARAGRAARRATAGSARRVRFSTAWMRRSSDSRASSSSSVAWRRWNSARSPARRVSQRDGPPITAASTRRRSQRAGVAGSASSLPSSSPGV